MRPRPTIRLRLTAWYAALFLACGAVLLGMAYVVVREEFEPQVEQRAAPGAPGAVVARAAERAADLERRIREEERRRDEQALRDVLGWFAGALGLMTVGSVGIGWLVAGRALAPVSRITATARRVSGQRLDERIGLDGPRDELRELAETFDAMLGRLDAAFASQRRFVANASHELRTPLAIIRAELEELEESGPAGADVPAMLANARRAAARSERLLGSLLTLARTDGALRRRPVDLAALVRDALEGARCAPAGGVRVACDLEPAEVAGDPVLLESLVVNLIENGLRHNRAGGELRIATRADGEAELVVANTGPDVDPAGLDRLFEPFARGKGPRAAGDHGSGLGLSIVRAVAAAHGGRVAAKPRAGGGLTVTVRLPSAPSAADASAPSDAGPASSELLRRAAPELTVGEQP